MTPPGVLALSGLLILCIAVGCSQDMSDERDGFDTSTLFFFPSNLADPVKVLRQNDDEVIATLSAGPVIKEIVTLDGSRYTRVRIPGFSSAAKSGFPEIPSVQVIVSVPDGKTLDFDVLERNELEAAGLEFPVAFQEREPFHNGKEVFTRKNAAAYDMIHGRRLVSVEEQSYAGRQKIAIIKFHPLKYDGLRREMTLTSFAKVRFYFRTDMGLLDQSAPVSGNGPGILGDIVLNHEQGADSRSQYAGKTDLIIAHESLREPLARYIAFKKQRGRQVREHYVTEKSAAEIKGIIAREYKSGNAPTHTLLVGNITMIPSFRGTADNTWTDFDYQALDSGSVPDISLGRIPAHNAQELSAFIDKAIGRETAKRNFNDVLLTAGKDANLGCPVNVQAVGNKFKAGGATVNTIRKFRSDGTSTQDVIGAYNASPNIIVYDGHGYQQGMSEIPLLINDLPQLTNTSFPIILDIACLNANWSQGANARNFAEKILFQQGSGAAGIMASGGSGNGHEYFQSIGQIMGAARARAGQGDNKMNEVGQVILAAKIKHGAQDRTFWNYYGDPASSVWEPEGGTGNGNVDEQQTAGSANIRFAIGSGESSAVLYLASDERAATVSLCEGSRTGCADTMYKTMKKVKTGQGTAFYATESAMTIKDGMSVTGKVSYPDGKSEVLEIKISQVK